MTVTLDSQTLLVEGGGISEEVVVVGVFNDRWISGVYKKYATILGTYKKWVLKCYENTAWASSMAKYFEDKAKTGSSVAFVISEGNLHAQASVNVYILKVSVDYRKGSTATNFVRNYALELQEAP